MKSGAVIEGLDVIEDGGAGLGAGGEAMMIDQFVFEAAKERLDEGRYLSSWLCDSWKGPGRVGLGLVGKRRWRTEHRDRSGV